MTNKINPDEPHIEEGYGCWCHPVVEHYENSDLVIHRSARELAEEWDKAEEWAGLEERLRKQWQELANDWQKKAEGLLAQCQKK